MMAATFCNVRAGLRSIQRMDWYQRRPGSLLSRFRKLSAGAHERGARRRDEIRIRHFIVTMLFRSRRPTFVTVQRCRLQACVIERTSSRPYLP